MSKLQVLSKNIDLTRWIRIRIETKPMRIRNISDKATKTMLEATPVLKSEAKLYYGISIRGK
jgi:hypothetical protein